MIKKRVLHVFGAMDVGGAEMRTIELMPGLTEHGVEFHFATLSGRAGTLAPRIEELGGRVWPTRRGLGLPIRFIRLCRSQAISVVDSHVATFSGIIVALAWCARVPVRIAHFRSDGDGQPDTLARRVWRRLMRKLISTFATEIVGVSPSALDYGYNADWASDPRARVIVNGVAPYRARAGGAMPHGLESSSDHHLMTLVARPSPEKNRARAIEVLAAMSVEDPSVRLVLVGGQGNDSDVVNHSIKRLGVADRVIDLGERSDVVDVMAASDLVLLTSTREGLPGVVLEALSTGTEVVSADLPGVRFIAESTGGLTIVSQAAMPQEWVAPLSAALARARDDSRRARQRACFSESAFSLESAVSGHLHLYGAE